MDIQDQIKRYEDIVKQVDKLKNDVQRETIELEYDKKNLKERMDDLQKKGIEFNNLTELEGELSKLSVKLEEVLTATERKLSEI